MSPIAWNAQATADVLSFVMAVSPFQLPNSVQLPVAAEQTTSNLVALNNNYLIILVVYVD